MRYRYEMEVVEEINKDKRPIIMVITGDGRAEFRRLKVFAERYDGEKVLWFPLKPIFPLKRKSEKKTGVNVLEVLNVYPGKYKLTQFLFVVDREHFKSENPTKKIEEFLRGKGINVSSVEQMNGGALCISCKVGPYDVVVYMAILGKIKSSEEELAELIGLELGLEVEANKRRIKEVLRSRNMREEDLIAKAKDKNLREAFPSLSSALTRIREEDCSLNC